MDTLLGVVSANVIRVRVLVKQKQSGKRMKVSTLKKASDANLIRLAKYLNLRIDGMGKGQIARLIKWRISLHREDNLMHWLGRKKYRD
jgi:hypothetical protein